MATKQVSLPTIGDITLYKRRGNRSLRLSIGAYGEVRVSLPYLLPYKASEEVAVSKTAWIVANRKPVASLLESGHAIGKAHRLYFEQRLGVGKLSTRIASN